MNDPDPVEDELAARLRGLVDDIAVPPSDGRADLLRGRRRARRRTALIAGGVTGACAAAVAVGVGATAGGGDRALDPAVQSASTAPSSASSTPTPAAPALHDPALNDPALHDPGCPAGQIAMRVGMPGTAHSALAVLLGDYADHLARHLDPTGKHLQLRPSNLQTSANSMGPCVEPGKVTGVGTKLDWSSPGDPGLGVVQIEVHEERPGQIRMQMSGWKEVAPPGTAVRAWTAQSGTDLAAEVQRADGTLVAVAASGLFGNNSTVALAGGTGLTTAQLLEAAADPAYTLP